MRMLEAKCRWKKNEKRKNIKCIKLSQTTLLFEKVKYNGVMLILRQRIFLLNQFTKFIWFFGQKENRKAKNYLFGVRKCQRIPGHIILQLIDNTVKCTSLNIYICLPLLRECTLLLVARCAKKMKSSGWTFIAGKRRNMEQEALFHCNGMKSYKRNKK